jgi:hypothetical protein
MKTIDTTGWADFLFQIQEIEKQIKSTGVPVSKLLFRGQADSRWTLKTTLERQLGAPYSIMRYYNYIYPIKSTIESHTTERWRIPEGHEILKAQSDFVKWHADLSFGNFPAIEYLAYLRHHGFPSPFLDWTNSRYVAAFFAFSEAIYQEDAENFVSIYVLFENNIVTRNDKIPCIYRLGPRSRFHRRHFSQQSEYTICLSRPSDAGWEFQPHDDNIEANWGQEENQINFYLYKFNIPAAERGNVLKSLDEYNLNPFSLFGSEESLIKTLAFRTFT